MNLRRPVLWAAVAALVFAGVQPAATRGRTVLERLGYPPDARLLIIHADDFGMAHSVNQAIIEALEKHWVTSASLLVPCPWFPEAATWARAHPDMDLGVHLAVNSEWTTFRWGPVSGRSAVPSLLDKDGYMPLLEDEAVAHAKPEEVERELRAQIDFAKAAGVHLTHLDSHMGTLFYTQALFDVYRRMGKTYGLPVLLERLGQRGGAESPYGTHAESEALLDRLLEIQPGASPSGWFDAYKKMLAPLPPGVYQLVVHLAHDGDEMRGATSDHPDWGAQWRQSDFDLVKSQEFHDFLQAQHFTLTSWRELAARGGAKSGK
ncbi:MAG TPA: polysaccharide deacetylase family protein [Vicinamibacterales bacterium]|nr:polysaccharide deacetylase family protein [Vicinamibacterales bacterium]